MRVVIDYEATYRYEDAVSFSPLTLRILPRPGSFLSWIAWSITTDPTGDCQRRVDLFGNETAFVFFDLRRHRCLQASARFDLEITPRNPFHFLLDPRAVQFPISYDARERRALAPFLAAASDSSPETTLSLPFDPLPDRSPTIQALCDLLAALHGLIEYEVREVGPARSPSETLALKRGACRDTALLLNHILKQRGLASRLASGFLCEFQSDPGKRVAKGAMHAWCEVFLPGAGWIGLDATNGVLCDHHYLTCAVGVEPDDVTPICGSYFAKNTVSSTLESKILLTQTTA